MVKPSNRYYLTSTGKVGKFVRIAGSRPDLYEIEVEGRSVIFVPSALSFIPQDKLPLIKRAAI